MKYVEIQSMDRDLAEQVFLGSNSDEIVRALLSVTWHESDWRWVQDRCLEYLDSPLPDVRNTAITCLGHLARIHRQIDKAKVLPALARTRADPDSCGRADDALEDIEMFTGTHPG